ncbi:MAG: DNA repair protein RadC [Bacillota bacterium]
MAERLRVKDLPVDDRPRERLIHHGPRVLTTSELLALLLGAGTRGESALDMGERILGTFGGLPGLARTAAAELAAQHGMGLSKACRLVAAIELGRRLVREQQSKTRIRSPEDARDLLMEEMRYLDKEHFQVVLLDTKNQVLGVQLVSIGGLASSIVHPREVFKEAIRRSAAAIILSHNHPSGDPTPSQDDIDVTRRLREAGKLLGIEVLDHIIIGDNRYMSLREKGL